MRSSLFLWLLAALLAQPLPAWALGGAEMPQDLMRTAVFLVFLILLSLFLLLREAGQHRQERSDLSLAGYILRKPTLWVMVGGPVLVLLITALYPGPDLQDGPTAYRIGRETEDPALIHQGARWYILHTPDTATPATVAEWHVQYVHAWLDLHARGEPMPVKYGAFSSPEVFYKTHPDTGATGADLRQLGLGIYYLYSGMLHIAHSHLFAVADTQLAYLHLYRGIYLDMAGERRAAQREWRQEIQYGAARNAAADQLEASFRMEGETDSVRALVLDPHTGPWVRHDTRRAVLLGAGEWGAWLPVVGESMLAQFRFTGLVSALLGLLVWLFYLRRLDVFRPRSWKTYLLLTGLGAVFSLAAFPLYDLAASLPWMRVTGAWGHDFLYSWFGVGMIEEVVKVAPFLILLALRRLRDPLDYVLYPALLALGFACMENILKFETGSLSLYHGRNLICVVSHMFDSALVGYVLLVVRFRYGGRQGLWVIPALVLASFSHGFYDFWLLSPAAQDFYAFTTLWFILSVWLLATLLNNALNQSPDFREDAPLEPARHARLLFTGLAGILFLEYLMLALLYGPALANRDLWHTVTGGSFLLIFMLPNLGYMQLARGQWFWFIRSAGTGHDPFHPDADTLHTLQPAPVQSGSWGGPAAEGHFSAWVRVGADVQALAFVCEGEELPRYLVVPLRSRQTPGARPLVRLYCLAAHAGLGEGDPPHIAPDDLQDLGLAELA